MVDSYFLASSRLGFDSWINNRQYFNELYENNDVTCYIGGPFNADQIEARYQRELTNIQIHGIQYWPLFLLDSGEFIGCCGLRPYSESVYELGFHLLPGYWGKGYGLEAANRVIEYAFSNESLHAEALFAGHNPNNVGSEALLRKLKFTCIGTQFYEPTGLQHPSYLLHRHT